MSTTGKVISWVSVLGILVLAGYLFFRFCFVYAEGVNEGDINYFQKEGFIFKTYEGKMIQTGLKSGAKGQQGGIQSNEFKFSVVDERVADKINSGSNVGVKLHWKRYLGTLPWRGNSQFIVDSIYSSQPAAVSGQPAVNQPSRVETPLPAEFPVN
ncbi:MAG: hypothetical protein IJS82_04420 [Paludibacteraceae bacterium]|nr:hypothetical protein [Paludibacteraceae bacterium]